MLKGDMEADPNGNLLHLVLLSHALSCPIQIIKDQKMHENIGAHFRGNPIIVSYNSNSAYKWKWVKSNNNPADSIFELVASTLDKQTDDIIDVWAKELVRNKQITSILRPAYKKFNRADRPIINEEGKQHTIDLGNSDEFEYRRSEVEDAVSELMLSKCAIWQFRTQNYRQNHQSVIQNQIWKEAQQICIYSNKFC